MAARVIGGGGVAARGARGGVAARLLGGDALSRASRASRAMDGDGERLGVSRHGCQSAEGSTSIIDWLECFAALVYTPRAGRASAAAVVSWRGDRLGRVASGSCRCGRGETGFCLRGVPGE